MGSISDRDVKNIALQEYPSDYSMQKYIYDEQLSAKQYMSTQDNSVARTRAQQEFANDYIMQMYTYDRILDGQ